MPTERALSGPGLTAIYEFFSQGAKLGPEEIVKRGLAKEDETAQKTLEVFASIYGAEAGNLGTRTLAYGGVYLVGSIVNSLKEYLNGSKTFFVCSSNAMRIGQLLLQGGHDAIHEEDADIRWRKRCGGEGRRTVRDRGGAPSHKIIVTLHLFLLICRC